MRAALAAALAGLAGAAGVASSAPTPAGAAATTTTTSNPWVPGVNGTLTVGIDQAPTGCNPNSQSGSTWADRLVLGPVLPSTFFVNSNDQAVYDPATITQAELQSTTPETVVYTINPRAVWSDGKPLTAQDFVYTWEQERGTTGPVGPRASPATPKTTATTTPALATPAGSPTGAGTVPSSTGVLPGATGTTGPSVGYRQISSVKPSNHGLTFTVVFKRPYADWQSLFNEVLPAHVLRKAGWSPGCTSPDPSLDLSAGPFVISKVVAGHEIDMVRNRRWWEQEPNLSRLDVLIASGPRQLARWLRNGTIQVALPDGYDQTYLQTVTSQPSVFSQSQPSTTFLELQFSTTSPLTSVTDLRLAVAHAVDRQAMIDKVVGWADSTIVPAASFLFAQTQNGYPAHKPPPQQVSGQPGYTPTTVSGKSPTATPFPPNAQLGTTDRMLTNLGYVRPAGGSWQDVAGKPITLRLAVDDGDPWAQQAAAALTHQLGAAGFVVDALTAPDAQSAGADLSSGAADLALVPMRSSPFPSQAIGWYTTLLGPAGTNGSQDWSGFNDPTVDSLLEKASEELNPVDASPIYSQVNTLLWQDMVGLPLFTQPTLLAWSGTTAGVAPDPNVASLLWSAQTWSVRVPPTSPDTQP